MLISDMASCITCMQHSTMRCASTTKVIAKRVLNYPGVMVIARGTLVLDKSVKQSLTVVFLPGHLRADPLVRSSFHSHKHLYHAFQSSVIFFLISSPIPTNFNSGWHPIQSAIIHSQGNAPSNTSCMNVSRCVRPVLAFFHTIFCDHFAHGALLVHGHSHE